MKGPGLKDRINAFCLLGKIMKEACQAKPQTEHARKLRIVAEKQQFINKWFTPFYVFESISALAGQLNKKGLDAWLKAYDINNYTGSPKRIGVIMAGNIPLVGFHDFLCVLITGNILVGKISSKDAELIKAISSILIDLEPGFKNYIILKSNTIDKFDAVIATGSNNTSRYFDYYFGTKPHIFRKNRNSIAVIDPDISNTDLYKLGKDVFYYFGLGCRSVSKIYLHADFNIKKLKDAWSDYSDHASIKPYKNNYIYNKALFTIGNTAFHDLGFILLKENDGLNSPVSVLYFSRYKNETDLWADIGYRRGDIQTIIGKNNIPFGMAQFPALNDYADGIDTIYFLLNL